MGSEDVYKRQIVDDDLSDDATQIVLKIRESGSLFGSSGSSADVTINYDGANVWSGEISFSLYRYQNNGIAYGQAECLPV